MLFWTEQKNYNLIQGLKEKSVNKTKGTDNKGKRNYRKKVEMFSLAMKSEFLLLDVSKNNKNLKEFFHLIWQLKYGWNGGNQKF